jgi:hypothetical protein
MEPLRYRWLPDELAVCRLSSVVPVPEWLPAHGFTSVTRTATELSIVCAEVVVPAEVKAERGWQVLEVLGPLPFDAVGILRRLTEPLADAGIPIIAIGTFNTDYVLVKEAQIALADKVLAAAGLIRQPGVRSTVTAPIGWHPHLPS